MGFLFFFYILFPFFHTLHIPYPIFSEKTKILGAKKKSKRNFDIAFKLFLSFFFSQKILFFLVNNYKPKKHTKKTFNVKQLTERKFFLSHSVFFSPYHSKHSA